MFKIIFVLLFLISCSHSQKRLIYKDVKEIYPNGTLIVREFKTSKKITFYTSTYNPDETDTNVNFSCFQDGYKSIVNHYGFLPDEEMALNRHMFFPEKTKYYLKTEVKFVNEKKDSVNDLVKESSYKYITKSCLFINKDGDYMPVTTDKIIFNKDW